MEQYPTEFAEIYADPDSCPPELLLWHHHLAWDYELPSGNTMWEELCHQYHSGAAKVTEMRSAWEKIEERVDPERFQQVLTHLRIQEKEAKWWRDACLTYFQSFSRQAIPAGLEQPAHDMAYYQQLTFPYAPGIKSKW
ncbi:MAG: hypothetical protein AB8H12_12595 [Lewinella sp.]